MKNDQLGEGQSLVVSCADDATICPVLTLKLFLQAGGHNPDDFTFRKVVSAPSLEITSQVECLILVPEGFSHQACHGLVLTQQVIAPIAYGLVVPLPLHWQVSLIVCCNVTVVGSVQHKGLLH